MGVLEVIADNIFAVVFVSVILLALIGFSLAIWAVNHVLSGGRLPFNLIFWVGSALSFLFSVAWFIWVYLL